MKVTLLNHTPLLICSNAIRTCWQSFDKSDNGGETDKALIDRVGNKYKHSSTLEHIVYSFYISGVSRALLQELARHRMASLSVKSTRYTLKELKDTNQIEYEKYLVLTGNEDVDNASKMALQNLQKILQSGIGNDIAKYCLPESYKTELSWTINARSLQNFLSLRSSKAALWEIRNLSNMIYENLPLDHKYLFEKSINQEE
ncbi:MAG: FAD-dependent thymidylate synthase [Arcobacteraceae bacterium]|jgi:thymidylate synthase (FAD)|nr:FAD-dependent thymidylate synthase [Arcobacteraceae bacterium]MDY0365263.1 FAD-dependent thymidylate synthase [Arcobacteraceae bacterium]